MSLHRVSRAARVTACSALVLVTLAGCGGGDESATDATAGESAAPAAGGASGGPSSGGGMPGGPGASGTIAAVSGTTLQVQSESSGQVAVTWTDGTTFSQQVAATLDDVVVGSCVMVTSDAEAAEGEPVAATTVRISEAEDGACTGGFGGPGGGERPEGMPTDLPSDLPSDLPTDRPAGGRGFGGTIGQVTAVSATGFTVERDDSSTEVTVVSATTYSATAAADASAVEVGRCATATGEADDTGAVTATRISVSDPVDGACSTGRGFGGPPAGGDAS